MNDLSSEAKRTFQQELILAEEDLDEREIMWNFRGEIFDSVLSEKFEIMYMQGEKYDRSLKGLGYHFHINTDKTVDIEKKVYRKN